MEQTIRFEANNSFSVPCDLVDKYLQAPETELKLMLILLRNPNHSFRSSELASMLGIGEEELNKAFRYWVKQGMLYLTAGKYILERPRLTPADFIDYQPDSVSRRMNEDSGIEYLMRQAEQSLRRPLMQTDVSMVLSLVDWAGLPPETAALLISNGADNGESLRKIYQKGIRWSEEGIRTFEQAEEEIRRETEKKQTANRIARMFGIYGTRALSDAEEGTFVKWVKEYQFDMTMIKTAYDEMIRSAGKYSYTYIDKILTSWHEAGYTDPKQALEAPKPKGLRTGRKSASAATIKKAPEKTETEAMDLAWEIAKNEKDTPQKNTKPKRNSERNSEPIGTFPEDLNVQTEKETEPTEGRSIPNPPKSSTERASSKKKKAAERTRTSEENTGLWEISEILKKPKN